MYAAAPGGHGSGRAYYCPTAGATPPTERRGCTHLRAGSTKASKEGGGQNKTSHVLLFAADC